MNIKKDGAKYSIPVYTKALAYKYAGYIECDSLEEYEETLDEHYDDLMASGYFSTNISNDFELNDVDIEDNTLTLSDLEFYKKD